MGSVGRERNETDRRDQHAPYVRTFYDGPDPRSKTVCVRICTNNTTTPMLLLNSRRNKGTRWNVYKSRDGRRYV